MIRDRRTGHDRRAVERYDVSLDAEWEGAVGRRQGTISDISELGCFILCSGEVENGETVGVFLTLESGSKLELRGEVVNHVVEIGFGVRFSGLTQGQKEFLGMLVDTIRK